MNASQLFNEQLCLRFRGSLSLKMEALGVFETAGTTHSKIDNLTPEDLDAAASSIRLVEEIILG